MRIRVRPRRYAFVNIARTRESRRRGITLIDMMVAVTMYSAILTLSGTTFYLLTRSEKMVTQSFLNERTTSRLAERFRDDVHQSESGSVIDQTSTTPNQLTLTDSVGAQIRYRVTQKGIARLLIDSDKIVARDDFVLPDCRINLRAGSESESPAMLLVIQRPGVTLTRESQAPRPLRTLEIQAHLRGPQLRNSVKLDGGSANIKEEGSENK